MSNSKNYGGIIGHKSQQEINDLIIDLKFGGLGFRSIAVELKNKYSIKTSHVTVSSYYKDFLNGESLDKAKSSIESKFENDGLLSKPYMNGEILESLMKEHGKTEKGKIYAKILALCASNVDALISGEERLKGEYMKYLKDIESIMKKS